MQPRIGISSALPSHRVAAGGERRAGRYTVRLGTELDGWTEARALTLEIYAMVLKRRDRAHFAEGFDSLMRDAIPSIRQAKMPVIEYRQPARAGAHRPEIAV